MRIGVPKEIHSGERRVATTPEVAGLLNKLGFEISVESWTLPLVICVKLVLPFGIRHQFGNPSIQLFAPQRGDARKGSIRHPGSA